MPHLRWAAALFFGCAAAPSARPPIDESAMREAIESSQAREEPYASSASYAHYLRARIAHLSGEHRRALDELRLALATDPGNPFLVTSLAEEYARLSELDRAERESDRLSLAVGRLARSAGKAAPGSAGAGSAGFGKPPVPVD